MDPMKSKILAFRTIFMLKIIFAVVGLIVSYGFVTHLHRTDIKDFTSRFTYLVWKPSNMFCKYPEARLVVVSKEEIDYAVNLPNGSEYNNQLKNLGECMAKMKKLDEDVNLCFCSSDRFILSSMKMFMFVLMFYALAHICLLIDYQITKRVRFVMFATAVIFAIDFFIYTLILPIILDRQEIPKMWLPNALYEKDYFTPTFNGYMIGAFVICHGFLTFFSARTLTSPLCNLTQQGTMNVKSVAQE